MDGWMDGWGVEWGGTKMLRCLVVVVVVGFHSGDGKSHSVLIGR